MQLPQRHANARASPSCRPRGGLDASLAQPIRRSTASSRPARPATATQATPDLVDLATGLATHLAGHLPPLAYEPVALPCSMMKCGDVVHRSTLDLALRGEVLGPDPLAFAALAAVASYLILPPGVLPGIIDLYVLAALYRSSSKVYSKEDIVLGRQLATGGFGTVYRADLREEDGSLTPVVVKKAKEFGEAEVWMNERMVRVGGSHCAEFVTAFDESSPSVGSPLDNAIWLVWKYEGDNTLYNLMEKKEFPYNLEPLLLNRQLKLAKGPRRKLVTIRLAMKQLLEALAACHNSGIVHRDTKPQNLICSAKDNKIKLIDLGAAADLRIGINYAPKEYLLDPRYAPPQQYIMSTQTPRPPPKPVAAFLSPVLWRMENPDRFDMYSCGVTLLQMAFANLRTDNALIAFRKKLQDKYKWDLREWRRQEEKKGNTRDYAEGFELLDSDGGAAWDLLCALMAYNPRDRPSAAEALRHPFFSTATASAFSTILSKAGRSLSLALTRPQQLIDDVIRQGAQKGGLTEASLMEELGLENEAPRPSRMASNTIVWWQERQYDFRKRQRARQLSSGSGWSSDAPKGGTGYSNANGNGNGNGKANGVPRPGANGYSFPKFGAAKPPVPVRKEVEAAIPMPALSKESGNGAGGANGNGNGNGNGASAAPRYNLGFAGFLKKKVSAPAPGPAAERVMASMEPGLGSEDEDDAKYDAVMAQVEKEQVEKKLFSLFSVLSRK